MATPDPGYEAATISLDRKPEQNLVLINGEYVNKPEHLYGWTDNNLSNITLYAWDDSENSSITYYTTSENPQVGDPVLNSSGELYETNYHVSRLITNGFEVSAS